VLVSTYKKSAELAAEKQQQWKDKENKKHLPEMLQKGFDTYADIIQSTDKLPQEWSSQIQPLTSQTKQILDELSFKVASIKDDKNTNQVNAKKDDIINSMRTFFIHTLDALQQFVDKIAQDAAHMTSEQKAKARENIQILAADLQHHQTILEKKRKFDFDVLMDVIKARLKS
jgi:methyl-accepting chemotaxis protein